MAGQQDLVQPIGSANGVGKSAGVSGAPGGAKTNSASPGMTDPVIDTFQYSQEALEDLSLHSGDGVGDAVTALTTACGYTEGSGSQPLELEQILFELSGRSGSPEAIANRPKDSDPNATPATASPDNMLAVNEARDDLNAWVNKQQSLATAKGASFTEM